MEGKESMTPYMKAEDGRRVVNQPETAWKPDRPRASRHALTASLAVMLVALSSRPAYANNPPGTFGEVLFAYLIPVFVIVLTTLGGGHMIIRRMKAAKPSSDSRIVMFFKTAAKTLFWLFIIVWSLAFAGMSIILCAVFGIYGLYRSYQLIRWGLAARRTIGRPDYLQDARPFRLISSGCVLAVIIVVLSASALTFAEHGLAYGPGGYALRLETSHLKNMVSLERQKMQHAGDGRQNQKELDALAGRIASHKEQISDGRRRYVVEHDKGGGAFTIYLLPAKESMIFTYPSYRADIDAEGKVTMRRAWVSGRETRCPKDADIIHEG